MKKMLWAFVLVAVAIAIGLTVKVVSAQSSLPDLFIEDVFLGESGNGIDCAIVFQVNDGTDSVVYHAYRNGNFLRWGYLDHTKGVFPFPCQFQSIELVVDPDNNIVEADESNNKVFLYKDDLISPVATPTPFPTPSTPEPTATLTPEPTATEVILPIPTATPPISCIVDVPLGYKWTWEGQQVRFFWGCQVESVNFYLDGVFYKNFQMEEQATVPLNFQTVEIIFDPDYRNEKHFYTLWQILHPMHVFIPLVAR